MGKADFYCDDRWIGSLYNNGQPWNIPMNVLLQTNKKMFEEELIEHLILTKSSLSCRDDKWPWLWYDSRLTEYSYFFLSSHNKVFMSMYGEELVDPIKIVQGEDVISSRVNLKYPDPKVVLTAVLQETVVRLRKSNGLKLTKII